ncbi:MAG: DMT family transporter, partial [Lapillicoccus sp.]
MPIALASAPAVPVGVLVAVLCAAVLHAVWNAIAHAVTDRLVLFAIIGAASTICAMAIVLASPAPARAAWPYLGASAVLHVGYNLLLMRCYRLGEFSQVYPLARGTSPWLVAVAAYVFAGEALTPTGFFGVGVISVGLASLVFTGQMPTRAQRSAIAAALLTGVVIAAYTTTDGIGIRHAGAAAGYIGWLFLLQSPVMPLFAVAVRGPRVWRQARSHLGAGVAGALLSVTAYGLVLWAQTRGALAFDRREPGGARWPR